MRNVVIIPAICLAWILCLMFSCSIFEADLTPEKICVLIAMVSLPWQIAGISYMSVILLILFYFNIKIFSTILKHRRLIQVQEQHQRKENQDRHQTRHFGVPEQHQGKENQKRHQTRHLRVQEQHQRIPEQNYSNVAHHENPQSTPEDDQSIKRTKLIGVVVLFMFIGYVPFVLGLAIGKCCLTFAWIALCVGSSCVCNKRETIYLNNDTYHHLCHLNDHHYHHIHHHRYCHCCYHWNHCCYCHDFYSLCCCCCSHCFHHHHHYYYYYYYFYYYYCCCCCCSYYCDLNPQAGRPGLPPLFV